MQRGFIPIWVTIGILVLISVTGGIYYLVKSSSKPTDSSPPTLTLKASPSPRQFIKRQFASKDYFESQPYPDELLKVSEDNLIGMRCTGWYLKQNGDYEINMEDGSSVKLTDQNLLQIVLNLNKSILKETNAFQACFTESNQTILEYETWGGGGGTKNIAHFGLVSSNGSFRKVSSIPNSGMPYFGCSTPLQLTKDNILYYSCGGADGGFIGDEIYAINLTTGTHRFVISCESILVDFKNDKTKVTCENS